MKRVWRHSGLGSLHRLWIALPLLILLLSVGGYLLTSRAIDRDRDATAERRARAESVETQQILGRARAYVQGLGNVLASERRPGQTRFATLAAGTAASVGLDDVLWIEEVSGAARRGYERRLRAPIGRLTSSGRVVRAPDAASYLTATFTSESRPELRPGVDVSNFPGLAEAVRDRATVFAVGASRPGSLGDEPGFYLLESASFGRTRGFLAAFVPRGWFVTTIGEDPRRVAISLEGRRIEGQLSSGPGTAGFETLGRRWEIDVGREPPSSLQSTLPWLALAWPVAIALIAFLVGRAVMLRRRAEREASGMFERSTDLLASAGFDGYYRRVNPAFMRTLGYSNAEMLSKPYTDFVHPDDLERTREAFAGMVLGGEEVIGFENRSICADGSVRWIQWNVRRALDEDVMYGVGRDVTESRRAERQFEEIFNVSPDLLCIIGLDGYCKRVNSAFEETFGYSSEDLMSRPILEFGHPDDLPMSRDKFERAARGETVTRFESRNIRADGTLLWLEWTARPLPEESVIYAAARDITERKRAEAEQAALRRVATLVAEDFPPAEIISAVAEEIGRIAPTEAVHIYRYEPDGTAVRVATWSELHEALPLGERIPPGGLNLAAMVWETKRAARLDDVSDVTGPVTEIVQRLGLRAAVASPIVVEGRLWGVVTGGTSKPEPMPADTEDRIADFTELVATAIANTESRAQLDVQAAQQAALRRVATLVAEDVAPSELFEAVARESGTLLGGDFSGLARFQGNDVFPVGVWAADGEHPPFPPRWEMQPGDPATRIAQTREPVRSDDWTGEPGPIAEFIRAMGIRSTVGTPIVVEGRLWGALALHSKQAAPLPPDTEPRMAQFTDLVATAIANREARAEVTRLADEQAALRRVATLVVRGVPPDEIFSTVAMELRRLFGADIATVGRFEEDRSIAILVGQAQAADAPPLKTRWEVTPPLATAEVARTGRPARMDGHDISTFSGETAEAMRRMGVRSAVASPIIVEGDLWGVITVSTNTEPLPPGAEERVTDFTDLVATAIANAKSRSELEASRARVVAASAEERRRVVRDLHDGAQQRLVHAVISLKLALRELRSGDPHPEDYVTEALDHAEQANSELRELVHGILPGVLTSGGLRAGIEDLVSRGSLPVDVDVSVDRFPPAVEATAYFVVSEALTNAVKHSGAQGAQVAARVDNGCLRVDVRDDGVGGADPGRGSGLTGLRDRIEALGGTFEIASPAGAGTSLAAKIPVDG